MRRPYKGGSNSENYTNWSIYFPCKNTKLDTFLTKNLKKIENFDPMLSKKVIIR